MAILNFQIPSHIQSLLQCAAQCASGPLYLVGGTLRDLALDRTPQDIDLAYSGKVVPFARRLSEKLGGSLVLLDDLTQVYRIALPTSQRHSAIRQIDIAQIQGRDIFQDLKRRDFTMNAMALFLPLPLDRKSPKILDTQGGMRDIRKKILRVNSDQAFKEDPLRLLRAFRLAAQLGLTLEPKTLELIRDYKNRISLASGERIHDELMSLLNLPQSSPWIHAMDGAGLLTALLKELEPSRQCALIYYGPGGVLLHSIKTVERLEYLLEHLDGIFLEVASPLRTKLSDLGIPVLKLAALLHDIAKPATAREIQGRLRFFGHDRIGADMSSKILKRLKFSRLHQAAVNSMIRFHLRPGNLAANPVITDRAMFRFFKELGPHGVYLLLMCWADHASYLEPSELESISQFLNLDPHTFSQKHPQIRGNIRKTLHHLQVVHYLLHRCFSHPEKVIPPKLVDGLDVMRILKIPPSREVGTILHRIQETQAEGKITSREQALDFLSRMSRSKNLPPKK